MFKLNTNQQIEIFRLKIIEIVRTPEYSENDKKIMKKFYQKKINDLQKSKSIQKQ